MTPLKILRKMTGNNPKLDLVDTKFEQTMSIHSQVQNPNCEGIRELLKDRANPV